MGAAVTLVLHQQEDMDCGVCALAMYLGIPYPDVLRAVTVSDRHQGKQGLWTATIQRVAKRLGHPLRKVKRVDWEQGYGILLLPAHASILRNGLVIDNGCVWDADAYLAHWCLEPTDCELLTNETH